MTDVKRLLEAATPLPWSVWDAPRPGIEGGDGPEAASVVVYGEHEEMEGVSTLENAALIVYAVNRLPDYEAAVDALERMVASCEMGFFDGIERPDNDPALVDARAALARLRGVPS